MLRTQDRHGWWLITHPDHARLAGDIAAHWGNELFAPPEPRTQVLHAIQAHDNGWAVLDAQPNITQQGKPAAFSIELVGRYSAFEEIDLRTYLNVRESAVQRLEADDAYAALLVCMHTYNLLTERADLSTISPAQRPFFDEFLEEQRQRQDRLSLRVRADPDFTAARVTQEAILNNFHLLQATDNLSLLSCVDYPEPAGLLHRLPLCDGSAKRVEVLPLGPREFRLVPWPLKESSLTFDLPARHLAQKSFSSTEELRERFGAAPIEHLQVKLTA